MPPAATPSAPSHDIPTWLTFLLAASCGLIVANLYYAQPLLGPMADSLGISRAAAGLIVTMTQCGYGLGLLLIVPLSDLIENRRLIVVALVGVSAALGVAALAQHAALLLVACLGIGIFAVAAQVIVPYASHLASEASRGRVVGNVMSGLLLGIMFSRPLASLVTQAWGWHAVFALSAVVTLLTALLLRVVLPLRRPVTRSSYLALLGSMLHLLRDAPVLRLRGFYHACAFAAFSLFWTVVPLYLAAAPFALNQTQIGLFALAGVAGAVAAPITARLADRGWSRSATPLAMLLMIGAFALSLAVAPHHPGALGVLVLVAIVLDMGVAASLLLGQRAVFEIGAQVRGRVNGLFMAMFFVGGAAGSSIGAWAYATGGWQRAALIGMALPAASLLWLMLRGGGARARLTAS